MNRTLPGLLALFASFATAAFAQTPYGEEGRACRHDAVHFCKGMTEEAAVRDCLVAQKHRISHHCRVVLERHGY